MLNLISLHMKPHIVAGALSDIKTTNKMFDAASDPKALIYLASADNKGKISDEEFVSHDEFLFERLNIYNEYMKRPFVMGKDLIEAGITEGSEIKELLSYSHKLRLAGIDKKSALKQTLSYLKEVRKNK